MPVVTLEEGHVQPVWAGHPWVFAQAIKRVEGGASPGDEVDVKDSRGRFLGRGLYSPKSAIPVRIFSRREGVSITRALFVERLRRATLRRAIFELPSDATNAYRVVHAEGDDLPGLVIDRYGDVVVVQIGTFGLHKRTIAILDAIDEVLGPRAIIDRTPASVTKTEDFEPGAGVVRGDSALGQLMFVERSLRYEIPLAIGQKTGFYTDQRMLRARVEELASGKRVLDAFAFVGAFALAAHRGGAREVVAVESSAVAHEVAAACAKLNHADAITFRHADARTALSEAAKKPYDLVVCDPPKLAPGRAAKKRALVAMRRLAVAATRATADGGLLVFCSCSGAIRADELARSLALGARDANVTATVLERWTQGPDHPVPAAFPDGLYLSSVIAQVRHDA